jgi:hypothetical protein
MKRYSNNYWLCEITYLVLAVVVLGSCSLKEPTAPNWNVPLNIPITNKSYTLFDIVEKKSTDVKHYTEGANLNILYYTHTEEIEKLGLENKIKIDPFSGEASNSIGTININDESLNSDVGLGWINPSFTAGQFVAVPQVTNAFNTINLEGAKKFKYAKIISGNVDVNFINYFPSSVSITINSFTIKNALTDEVIVQSTSSVVVPPNKTSTKQKLPLIAGVTISNQTKMECRISTTGSNGQSITLPNYSIGVSATTNNVKVSEANAIIPDQSPTLVDGTVMFDEDSSTPNKLIKAKLDGGLMSASITNNMNVDLNINFTLDNLKTPSDVVFSVTKFVPAKRTVNLFSTSNLNLSNYSLVSSNNLPTNVISYHVNAVVIPSSDYKVVNAVDDISATVNFKDISISQFVGKLKPIVVDQERSAISLDLQDLQAKMKFLQIDLKNPRLEFRLYPTANVEFAINGKIEAKNSKGEKGTLLLNDQTLNSTIISPTNSVLTLKSASLSNFFKSFTQFPDSLIVYAGGTVNPNYGSVDVKQTDQITGNSVMEIPFEFGLTGGEFSDSIEVDLSQDDRDQIKDVNTISAELKISNGIATSISFVGKLYDKYNNQLIYFPPKYQDQDTIVNVGGAIVDADGKVTSPNVQTILVKIAQGDSPKIANAAYMRIRLMFGTTGNQQVKFKTEDVIKITASGSTNYHVKP